jgi:hypothetical protein
MQERVKSEKRGGLGANIGGDDWLKKKLKAEAMIKFAEKVRLENLKKQKESPDRQEKNLGKNRGPREKAIDYS